MEPKSNRLIRVIRFIRTNTKLHIVMLIILLVGIALNVLSNLSFNNPTFDEVSKTPGSIIATLDRSNFIPEQNYEYVDDDLQLISMKCLPDLLQYYYTCSNLNDSIKFEFRGNPSTGRRNLQVAIKDPLLTVDGVASKIGCWQYEESFLCMEEEKISHSKQSNK